MLRCPNPYHRYSSSLHVWGILNHKSGKNSSTFFHNPSNFMGLADPVGLKARRNRLKHLHLLARDLLEGVAETLKQSVCGRGELAVEVVGIVEA